MGVGRRPTSSGGGRQTPRHRLVRRNGKEPIVYVPAKGTRCWPPEAASSKFANQHHRLAAARRSGTVTTTRTHRWTTLGSAETREVALSASGVGFLGHLPISLGSPGGGTRAGIRFRHRERRHQGQVSPPARAAGPNGPPTPPSPTTGRSSTPARPLAHQPHGDVCGRTSRHALDGWNDFCRSK